jgi:8-oxo-dGTP diphosphatase
MLIYALGIFQKDSKILLSLRQNSPYFSGYYGLIGGGVEDKEAVVDALIREIYEEIGISITKEDAHFTHCLSFKNEQDKAILALVFTIHNWHGEIVNKEPDKCAELVWFMSNDLPENIIPRHRHIIEMVQQDILYSEDGW